MSAIQKRVEAMEKVGAGPLADQTLRKLIQLQLQKYQKHLEAALRELEPFERQHGMNSEECHRRFVAGELGDAADIMEWMGLYEDVILYRERIDTLRAGAAA